MAHPVRLCSLLLDIRHRSYSELAVRRTHSTALAIQGDVALMSLLREWCKGHTDSNGSNTGHRLDNMRCERQLASYRRTNRHLFSRPNVKRVMTHGYLDEISSTHRLAGGLDPRGFTRSRVETMGIETRRKKVRNKPEKTYCPGHINYISAALPPGLGKEAHWAERARLAAEFRDLPEDEKNQYTRSKDMIPGDIDLGVLSADQRYKKRISQQLWDTSDRFDAIRPDVIESEMCKHAEVWLIILWR